MTADEYVLQTVSKYRSSTGEGSPAQNVAPSVLSIVKPWANGLLLDVFYSGSYAKGTAIHGITDVDFFISLSSDTPQSLKEIYNSLHGKLQERRLSPRAQNVSIGISMNGISIDLVPGKKQAGNTNNHSLYKRRGDTWMQTNIDTHVNLVKRSGRISEICALKIWRARHGLDFPSFYLELAVIEALKGRTYSQPASNVLVALSYIGENLPQLTLKDPANSNNVVSEDLTLEEKRTIARQAAASALKPTWEQIIW
jgi:hypothetical protein